MPQFKRYILPDHCYFATTATKERRAFFADPRLSQMIMDNLRFYRDHMGFRLHGYVVMPDHVHLLITPGSCSISDIMRNFKSFTGKQIREALRISGPIWQSRFYDRVIRDEAQFVAALNYIHLNPVKDGLVSLPEDYEFSSCGTYARSEKSPFEIDLLDGSRLGP
ncbi:MAG: transposase [Chloroflexi bacterium]|nr:transposase [Chloroflexota bacterium]